MKNDTKIFSIEVSRKVIGWMGSGLEFVTYTFATMQNEDGTLSHFVVEGSGPTPTHADLEFAKRMAAFRRELLKAHAANEAQEQHPHLKLVDNDET